MCVDGSCIRMTTPIPNLKNTTTVDPFLLEDIYEQFNWNDTTINNANRSKYSISLRPNFNIINNLCYQSSYDMNFRDRKHITPDYRVI